MKRLQPRRSDLVSSRNVIGLTTEVETAIGKGWPGQSPENA